MASHVRRSRSPASAASAASSTRKAAAVDELVAGMKEQLGLKDEDTVPITSDELSATGVELLGVHDYPQPGLFTICTVGVASRTVHGPLRLDRDASAAAADVLCDFAQEFALVVRRPQVWSADTESYAGSVLNTVLNVVEVLVDDVDATGAPVQEGNFVSFARFGDARPVTRPSRGFGGVVTAKTDLRAALLLRTPAGLPLQLVDLVPVTELEALLLDRTDDGRPPQALQVLGKLQTQGVAKYDLDRDSVDLTAIFPEAGELALPVRSDNENAAAVRLAVGATVDGSWEVVPPLTYELGNLRFRWEAYRGYSADVTVFYTVGASHMTGTASIGDQHCELLFLARTRQVVDPATGQFHGVLARLLHMAADSYNNLFSSTVSVSAMAEGVLFHEHAYLIEMEPLGWTMAATASAPPPPDFRQRRNTWPAPSAAQAVELICLLPLTLDEYYHCVRTALETDTSRYQVAVDLLLSAFEGDVQVDFRDLARATMTVAQGAQAAAAPFLRQSMLAQPTTLAPWVAAFFERHGVLAAESSTLGGIRGAFETLKYRHVPTDGRVVWEAFCRLSPGAPPVNLYMASLADVTEEELVLGVFAELGVRRVADLTEVSTRPRIFPSEEALRSVMSGVRRATFLFYPSSVHDEEARVWGRFRDQYVASTQERS